MFEAISKTTQTQVQGVQAQEKVPKKVDLHKPAQEVEELQDHQLKEVGTQNTVKERKADESLVPDTLLKDLEEDFEMIHNVGLHFSIHDGTGRTMVKVINKDNGTLIREIPSEEVLNLAAKLDEMIGIIFDETV
jgi:flagellar protein FlaG